MRSILVVLILVTLTPSQALPGKESLIYLFIGQSNCDGQGQPALPDDEISHPRVWTLDRDQQIRQAVEPVGFGHEYPGVGPALAFGKLVAEHRPANQIILVPAAASGVSLERWLKGAEPIPVPFSHQKVRLYDHAIQRALLARSLTNGTIAGIIWHQGEGDSFSPERASAYGPRLRSLLTNLRQDLGNPCLPIVAGELPRFLNPQNFPLRDLVVEQTKSLANPAISSLYLPGVSFAESFGAAANQREAPNYVHFNAAGQHLMAERYFNSLFPKKAAAENWNRYE